MNPKPDWAVFYDYFLRKQRGETPKHLYDGYQKASKPTPEKKEYPQGVFISENRASAEKARADLKVEREQKAIKRGSSQPALSVNSNRPREYIVQRETPKPQKKGSICSSVESKWTEWKKL